MGEPFHLHLRLKHFFMNQMLHKGRASLQPLLFFRTWCQSSNFSMLGHELPTVSSLPSLSLSEEGIACGSCEGLTLQGWNEGVMQKGTLSPPRKAESQSMLGYLKTPMPASSTQCVTAWSNALALTRESSSPVLVTGHCEQSSTFQAASASLGSFAVGHDTRGAPLCTRMRARLKALSAGRPRSRLAPGRLSALSRCLSPARTA